VEAQDCEDVLTALSLPEPRLLAVKLPALSETTHGSANSATQPSLSAPKEPCWVRVVLLWAVWLQRALAEPEKEALLVRVY